MDLANASLLDIIAHIQRALSAGASRIEIDVLDPDRGRGRYAGERIVHADREYVHRPFRVWVDLAERLGLRLLTPRPLPAQAAHSDAPLEAHSDAPLAAHSDAPLAAHSDAPLAAHSDAPLVRLAFERLDPDARLRPAGDDPTEKYGASSAFARISKLEDPGFVLDMAEALDRIDLRPGARVLDLGVNTGDELALLVALAPALRDATLVGIDHSASAIAVARERFRDAANVELHVADLSTLAALDLGRFDLVVSIGTLQSPGIDDRELVRQIVQHHLAATGAVIFGFPNCRYIDGEVEYGTRMKNFRQPELGLLIKDVAFYRKYLQQHHRQVFVTGNHYVLVTGVRNDRVDSAIE